jgi:YgiT-type zinc finger domain-containing protein
MKFTQCPLCESIRIQKKKGNYKFEIDDKVVLSPIVEYWECANCSEAFFDQKANKKIDKAMLASKTRKMNVVIH